MKSGSLEVVILCGGRGERLRPISDETPKPMIDVFGKPFLEHQIVFFKRFGFRSFWLCTGYLGDVIRRHFGGGSGLGVQINYSREESPLGTGGAILALLDRLGETFLVVNGDTLADLDPREFAFFHDRMGKAATISVVAVPDPERCNVVNLTDGYVDSFHTYGGGSESNLIDAGFYMINKDAFSRFRLRRAFSLNTVLAGLVGSRDLAGYTIRGEYFEIGTQSRLQRARALRDRFLAMVQPAEEMPQPLMAEVMSK